MPNAIMLPVLFMHLSAASCSNTISCSAWVVNLETLSSPWPIGHSLYQRKRASHFKIPFGPVDVSV